MAGTFSIGEQKVRPGVYHRYENAGGLAVADAVNGIGAALFQSDWGPLNTLVELDLSADPAERFGSGLNAGILAELFSGGCVKVMAVRVGQGGAAGSVILKDGAEVDVLELKAAYPGARSFSVSVRDSLSDGQRECILYDGVKEFEKVRFTGGAKELAEAFAKSKSFAARLIADGDGTVKDVSQAVMEGGANPTATVAEYSAGMSALEAFKWNVLCLDTVDVAVQALAAAFVQRIEQDGKFPMACFAETMGIDLETRMRHAAAFNDEKLCYVLGAASDASGTVYDGWRLAARIGGMIAAVKSSTSLTHKVVPGFTDLAETLTNRQVEKALSMGCLCLTLNANRQVWIESAINTLVAPKENQDAGWKKIRRTKTRFELMDRLSSTLEPLVGSVNNDTDGQATIIAAGQNVINTMIAEKKLLAGGKLAQDSANPAAGDSLWLVIDVDDIDSAEKIYLTYRFRFSPNS